MLSIVLLILVVIFATLFSFTSMKTSLSKKSDVFFGGGGSNIVVVDTLNLLYWMKIKGSHNAAIMALIEKVTPKLKLSFPDKIFFVVKNVEFDKDKIQDLCDSLKICVAITYDYEDPPKGVQKNNLHSASGKDDLYMILLSQKYRCPIISNDRFRDLELLKTKIQPYKVVIYNYWAGPIEDWVRPEIKEYKKIKRHKVKTILPGDFF